MPILQTENLTPAQVKARRVINRINSAYAGLTNALAQSVADIYGDPAATQAVLDAFGQKAGWVFGLSNIAVEAINAAVTLTGEGQIITSVVPASHVVTINPDGTATDLYTPPEPPAPVEPNDTLTGGSN